uniref:Uncharacterized protein n=1 Tax=Scleropages formosus TaxID=113540 RepID=A0A8C9WBF9_SCLFO
MIHTLTRGWIAWFTAHTVIRGLAHTHTRGQDDAMRWKLTRCVFCAVPHRTMTVFRTQPEVATYQHTVKIMVDGLREPRRESTSSPHGPWSCLSVISTTPDRLPSISFTYI